MFERVKRKHWEPRKESYFLPKAIAGGKKTARGRMRERDSRSNLLGDTK